MSGAFEIVDWGRIPYAEAWRLQRELVDRRANGEISDRLILCEHEPVITAGRRTPAAALGRLPYPLHEIERGGELTYHGPGQLVGYPILDLRPRGSDLHRYLRDLEEVLVRALARFGLDGRRNPPHTGVWVGSRKIASIGVAVKRWVSYHGFALNVTTDLTAFASFQPCGLEPTVMTSFAALGVPTDVEAVKPIVSASFAEVFEVALADL